MSSEESVTIHMLFQVGIFGGITPCGIALGIVPRQILGKQACKKGLENV